MHTFPCARTAPLAPTPPARLPIEDDEVADNEEPTHHHKLAVPHANNSVSAHSTTQPGPTLARCPPNWPAALTASMMCRPLSPHARALRQYPHTRHQLSHPTHIPSRRPTRASQRSRAHAVLALLESSSSSATSTTATDRSHKATAHQCPWTWTKWWSQIEHYAGSPRLSRQKDRKVRTLGASPAAPRHLRAYLRSLLFSPPILHPCNSKATLVQHMQVCLARPPVRPPASSSSYPIHSTHTST
jgi:hypothetical protein